MRARAEAHLPARLYGITAIAITPDGKTAYVVSYASGKVTPISTATNKAGKPIKVKNPYLIAITPSS